MAESGTSEFKGKCATVVALAIGIAFIALLTLVGYMTFTNLPQFMDNQYMASGRNI